MSDKPVFIPWSEKQRLFLMLLLGLPALVLVSSVILLLADGIAPWWFPWLVITGVLSVPTAFAFDLWKIYAKETPDA